MSNRPPIPAEHWPILKKVWDMLLEYALAEQAKKEEATVERQSPPTTEDLPVTEPLSL